MNLIRTLIRNARILSMAITISIGKAFITIQNVMKEPSKALQILLLGIMDIKRIMNLNPAQKIPLYHGEYQAVL